MKTNEEREKAKQNIKVSAEVKTILCDLFNQIQYEIADQYEEFREENERLNNIINELEKDLQRYDLEYLHETGEHQLADAIEDVLDKLNELKENNNE